MELIIIISVGTQDIILRWKKIQSLFKQNICKEYIILKKNTNSFVDEILIWLINKILDASYIIIVYAYSLFLIIIIISSVDENSAKLTN